MGQFAQGVRIGVGAQRQPALYGSKKRWRLASQSDAQDYLEDKAGSEGARRNSHASINELADKVEEVMEDQANRDK